MHSEVQSLMNTIPAWARRQLVEQNEMLKVEAAVNEQKLRARSERIDKLEKAMRTSEEVSYQTVLEAKLRIIRCALSPLRTQYKTVCRACVMWRDAAVSDLPTRSVDRKKRAIHPLVLAVPPYVSLVHAT